MLMADEDKVVFDEDGVTRSLNGIIVEENDNFVVIERRDGLHKIAIKTVLKIIYKGQNDRHDGGGAKG